MNKETKLQIEVRIVVREKLDNYNSAIVSSQEVTEQGSPENLVTLLDDISARLNSEATKTVLRRLKEDKVVREKTAADELREILGD